MLSESYNSLSDPGYSSRGTTLIMYDQMAKKGGGECRTLHSP